MLTRTLVGVAACLGAAGPLAAQPAATLGQPRQSADPPRQYASYTGSQAPAGYAGAAPRALPGTTIAGVPAARYGAVRADTPAPVAQPPVSAQPPAAPAASYPTGIDAACLGYGPDCGAGCGTCDCLCGPPGRAWVSAEWLFWSATGQSIPPLATAAPPGTARTAAGALGAAGTGILFGGNRVNDDFRSGYRLNAGVWLDECQRFGIQGDFFFLGQSRQRFAAGSNGTNIVSRPFINGLTGAQDAELVSFPNVLAGTVTAEATSNFIGGGGSFVHNLCCDPCGRVDLTYGFRYLNLRDEVVIREDLTALPGSGVAAGTRFLITDRFRTNNDFYGVPIGLQYERRWSHWFVGARASVALGVSHQETTIDGSTTIIPPGGPAQTYPGGLLTQPSNIGKYSTDKFAVVPEVGFRVGSQVTDRLRVFAGYNLIYWSSVARAGDQIDLRVNTNQIAPSRGLGNGPAVPAYRPKSTDFTVQGISLGAEYRF